MTVVEKLIRSVHDALDERNESGYVVSAFPLYYDTPETVNMRVDNARFPCAMLNVVQSGTALNENGVLRERVTCEVVFAEQTVLDFDGEENERIIDRLKWLAFYWLATLKKSGALLIEDDVQTMRYYATNDAVLTGFGITVRVKELEGVSACDIPYNV